MMRGGAVPVEAETRTATEIAPSILTSTRWLATVSALAVASVATVLVCLHFGAERIGLAEVVAILWRAVQEGRLAEGPVLYWHTFNALSLPAGPLEDADPSRLPRAFRSLVPPQGRAGRVQGQR